MLEQYFIVPAFDPVLVHIGPLAIRWYALAYIFGLLGGWWYGRYLIGNTKLWPVQPGTKLQFDDLLIWVTLGVVVGGRLGMLFWEPEYYLANPIEILKVWNGGMAFHGGFLGAALAVILFAWLNKIPILSYLDIAASVAPIGLFLGRIANFINDELWGRPAWGSSWGMISPSSPLSLFPEGPTPRYPSQLLEAALEGLALFVLFLVLTRFGALKRPGLIAGLFGIGYAAARSFGELYREPDGWWIQDVLTTGQAYSVPMAIAGLALVIYALARGPGTPKTTQEAPKSA
ncbi:prolipoprotein diacylglyceryl transferase [Labrys neptuniae]